MDFVKYIREKASGLNVSDDMLKRAVNTGFSGGEKKRMEILQMSAVDPKLAILDETDSGLDIDALKVVAQGINSMPNKTASLIITHYQRLLDHVKPDFVHAMIDGIFVKSGGPELAIKVEEKGYDWLEVAV